MGARCVRDRIGIAIALRGQVNTFLAFGCHYCLLLMWGWGVPNRNAGLSRQIGTWHAAYWRVLSTGESGKKNLGSEVENCRGRKLLAGRLLLPALVAPRAVGLGSFLLLILVFFLFVI